MPFVYFLFPSKKAAGLIKEAEIAIQVVLLDHLDVVEVGEEETITILTLAMEPLNGVQVL